MIWPSPVIRIHLITVLLPDTLWMFRIWQCYVESWTENCFWHDRTKQRLAIRIHMTIFTLCTTIFTPVDIFITQNSVDHCEWERTPQWIWDRASQNCDFLFCYWCCCCVEYIAIECVYVKTRFECLQKYIAIRWMAAYGSMRKRQLEAFVFIWFAYVHAFEKKVERNRDLITIESFVWLARETRGIVWETQITFYLDFQPMNAWLRHMRTTATR